MRDTYSLYEAKAKFSALIRQVREGRSVTITYRGEPVAELRPSAPAENGTVARMKVLEERGILTRGNPNAAPIRPGPRRPGALKRFLDERD